MRIKLVNRTRWNTRDIRRLVTAGLKAEVGEWFGTYTVVIKTRRGRVRGYGTYDGRWMQLMMPKDGEEIAGDGVRRIARTIAHEVMHNKGVRSHREIDDSERDLAWADVLIAAGFVIHRNVPAKKGPVDHQARRAAHAQVMLKQHERALKREKKLVSRWRQKVRYYERVLSQRDPDHVAKVAAERAARKPFSPSEEVKRIAAEQGIKVVHWDDPFYSTKVTLEAPQGRSWGGTHELECTGWRDALSRLRAEVLEDCEADCDCLKSGV